MKIIFCTLVHLNILLIHWILYYVRVNFHSRIQTHYWFWLYDSPPCSNKGPKFSFRKFVFSAALALLIRFSKFFHYKFQLQRAFHLNYRLYFYHFPLFRKSQKRKYTSLFIVVYKSEIFSFVTGTWPPYPPFPQILTNI